MSAVLDRVLTYLSTQVDPRIVLLHNREVVQWLFADLSFLPSIVKKNKTADEKALKVLEDTWGRKVMKERRPDLKMDQQWTNRFGEYLCEELCLLQGKTTKNPKKQRNYKPDWEVEDMIVEAKAQTFFTSGTAGEKILGCPFKYAEVPDLYGKPLQILCMGGAEQVCRKQYGNLEGVKCSPQKKKFLEFFQSCGITYIGATDILMRLAGVEHGLTEAIVTEDNASVVASETSETSNVDELSGMLSTMHMTESEEQV